MHLIAIRPEVVDKNPWVAQAVFKMFNDAKEIAERYYDDPNWSRLAWGRHYFEGERKQFSGDPWQNGFNRNRANIERFISYSPDQNLIATPLAPEILFCKETLDT